MTFSWFYQQFSLLKSSGVTIFYAKFVFLHQILTLDYPNLLNRTFLNYFAEMLVGSFVFLILYCILNKTLVWVYTYEDHLFVNEQIFDMFCQLNNDKAKHVKNFCSFTINDLHMWKPKTMSYLLIEQRQLRTDTDWFVWLVFIKYVFNQQWT